MNTRTTFLQKLSLAAVFVFFFAFSANATITVTGNTTSGYTILIEEQSADFSSLRNANYSGDLVSSLSTLRYPGPKETIQVEGSNGFKSDGALVLDISGKIGNLILGGGNNHIGLVILKDNVIFEVSSLDATNINKNHLNIINADPLSSTKNGVLYYTTLTSGHYNSNISTAVQPITALPVEFLSFTVAKQGTNAMLNFATAWEINNAGFEVERSTNGISWNKIGFVAGKGNSTEINNYSFATSLANINAAVVYYRLKQVDFNGQFDYSATRTVRLSAAAAKAVSVYPNPAASKISVSLEGVAAGEMARISIMDMSGKVLVATNQIVEEGNYTLDMNIDNLTNGNYIVNIASPSANYNTKLVKF